jgi:hypothetical protein
MKLILILGLAGSILCASVSVFGQSKIEATAEADVAAEVAFPFTEKQSTGVEWEYGEGGEFYSQVVKDHEYSWMCDYSCTITAELAEDAFYFVAPPINEGLIDEQYIYEAQLIATVKRNGDYFGFENCDFEEEYSSPFTLVVQDYTTEGWLDITWIDWGEDNWPPCFVGPLLTEITP